MCNETAAAPQIGDEFDEIKQQIIDAVAHVGPEFVLDALSDACYIAAAVYEELREWPRMHELLHYAHCLQELPIQSVSSSERAADADDDSAPNRGD